MNTKSQNKISQLIKAFSRSLIAGFLLSLIALLLFAFILYTFGGSQKILSIGVILIYIISTFVTGYLCGHMMQNRKFIWGSLVGLSYFLILLLISLCFPKGDSVSSTNTFTVLILCVASSTIGGMLA